MAYQGLGRGIVEETRSASALFAAELPEVLMAVSCSKNFGLYRERTGTLHVVTRSAAVADAALSQLARIARTIYSMPPDHGAAIVQGVLADEALRAAWLDEVACDARAHDAGCARISSSSWRRLVQSATSAVITRQLGMFSLLGINTAQVRAIARARITST